MAAQQQVIEYKVVHLALKDDKRWEEILCGLGHDGWVLSGTVPLIDISFAGFPVTRGAQFILMRPGTVGQGIASSQSPRSGNSAADAFARGAGARRTG